MTCIQNMKRASTGLAVCLAALPGATGAQQQTPSQSYGISTGMVFNDNRGLDTPSLGNTTEVFTRFDFGLVFSNPLESLSVDGEISLRAIDGAEDDFIPDGLADPRLRLTYNRAVRDAELTVTAFGIETETNTLVEEFDGLDLTQINENATRLTYGFDAELELGKTDPFGVTFFAGYTGLRYSDTRSTTLQDQDRSRIGADFRFDINPVLRATFGARYRTFEEEGSTDGLRETFDLTAGLDRAMESGSFGIQAEAVSVEEGERYGLSVLRSLETEFWEVGGSLGVEESVTGDTFGSASLNIARSLADGIMSFGLDHRLRSGLDDEEEEFTSIRFNYRQPISAQGTVGVTASYQEADPTGPEGTTSLGTIGLTYQHALADGWDMNFGLDHRVTNDSNGVTARDNRLLLSIRRELSALR